MAEKTKAQNSLRSEHASRCKMAPKWKRTRDAVEGGDAIVDARADYLPVLKGMSDAAHKAYAIRPEFYEATGRTLEAMGGLVFSRPSTVTVPTALEALLDDIDFAGNSLADFERMLVDEELTTAFGAIVVNHSGDPNNPGTLANPSGRVYLSYYPAESVLDWRFQKRPGAKGGARELVYLKVFERVEQPGTDEFSTECVEQFRVFDLVQGESGETIYRQRVFQEVPPTPNDPSGVALVETAVPLINGKPWTYLPIAMKEKPGDPTLRPLADTNISHWRTLADLETGLHFTGLPTPWVSGYTLAANEEIELGSTTAMVFPDKETKCGFLHFGGDGLAGLEKMADRKESHMAALGARMLAPEKKQAESGEALAIRNGGESGALSRCSKSVSSMLTKAMQYAALWSGVKDTEAKEVSVQLNTQFVNERLSPQEIDALMKAYMGGGLSLPSLLFNMQRGNRLPEGVSPDDEADRIAEGAEALGLMNDNEDPAEEADPNEEAEDDAPPPPARKKAKAKKGAAA